MNTQDKYVITAIVVNDFMFNCHKNGMNAEQAKDLAIRSEGEIKKQVREILNSKEYKDVMDTPKVTNKTTIATSYRGHHVNASINQMIKLFGETTIMQGGDPFHYMWDLEYKGKVFTIYDANIRGEPNLDALVSFKIGAYNNASSLEAKEGLLHALSTLK